jgi:hypothetical protein
MLRKSLYQRAGRLDRSIHRSGVVRYHQQQHASCGIRLAPALFPIPYRRGTETKPTSESRLCDDRPAPETLSDRRHVYRRRHDDGKLRRHVEQLAVSVSPRFSCRIPRPLHHHHCAPHRRTHVFRTPEIAALPLFPTQHARARA